MQDCRMIKIFGKVSFCVGAVVGERRHLGMPPFLECGRRVSPRRAAYILGAGRLGLSERMQQGSCTIANTKYDGRVRGIVG